MAMFGAPCSACCGEGCPACQGETCCGADHPRVEGECCDGEWRTEEGVCCDGQWYPAESEGECCGDVWQTGEGECCGDTWETGEGECCGGVWHTEEGDCCGDVWYPAASPCAEGQIFLRWGENDECCGCLPDSIDSVPTTELVEYLCCPACPGGDLLSYEDASLEVFVGCYGRCCDDGVCTNTLEADCQGEWFGGTCCEGLGCPVACCSENASGTVICNPAFPELLCNTPNFLAVDNDCDTGCVGECCIDGESQGQKTQAECDDLGGCWGGLGSTECPVFCRGPFSETCCESKQSSAAGLTFTQPGRWRCPEFTGTLRVTVTGTTDSAILIHGTPFGENATPTKRCPINHTFLICWDNFNIEPVPCGTNFHNLDVEVCWEEEATQTETLNFSGCNDITVWLGACDRDNCVTTLLYTGPGHTTNAQILLHGNAVIDGSGTGSLQIGAPSPQNSCVNSLTLTGTYDGLPSASVIGTELNAIGAILNPSGGSLAVFKTGSGTWRLTQASSFSGRLTVLDGTIVATADANSTGSGVFGTQGPLLGSSAANASGRAALLLGNDASIARNVEIAALGAGSTQEIILGVADSSSPVFTSASTIFTDRDVTLQAAAGGTIGFGNLWRGVIDTSTPPAVAFNVGSVGNTGTVAFSQQIPDTITAVNVRHGRLRLAAINEPILNFATPVTLGSASGGATLEFNVGEQSFSALSFVGVNSEIVGTGAVALFDVASAATPVFLNVTGTGHKIDMEVRLDNPSVIDVDSGSDLQILGETTDGFRGTQSLTKDGSGTLTLTGDISYTGDTTVSAGTLVVEKIFDGSPDISQATFTATTLEVAFTTTPASAATYQLLGGATTNSYTGQVTLTGAGGATGTYDSATSTLTID